jgi:hypothetical protein
MPSGYIKLSFHYCSSYIPHTTNLLTNFVAGVVRNLFLFLWNLFSYIVRKEHKTNQEEKYYVLREMSEVCRAAYYVMRDSVCNLYHLSSVVMPVSFSHIFQHSCITSQQQYIYFTEYKTDGRKYEECLYISLLLLKDITEYRIVE